MKRTLLLAAVVAAAVPMIPTQARAPDYDVVKATVVERNSAGRATKVMVGTEVYAVCEGKVQDECINPRQAGLNFGNAPLDHWPGKPASEVGE